jgi:hypothetical protein
MLAEIEAAVPPAAAALLASPSRLRGGEWADLRHFSGAARRNNGGAPFPDAAHKRHPLTR